MPEPILPQLRSKTAQAHQQLEDRLDMNRQLADVDRYRTLLKRFYGYYSVAEPRILRLPGWEGTRYRPYERLKTPWLIQDLLALGLDHDQISALPYCPRVPGLDDLAAGFGCAYVLEGSTLGGRQIGKMLEASKIPVQAWSFFRSYGEIVGERWKEFCAALEEYSSVHVTAREHLLDTAEQTFSTMEAWLCRELP